MKQRKANRLNGYDYSQDNLYFVTSCVHNMVCCFGEIVVGPGDDLLRTGHDLSDDDNLLRTGHDLSVHDLSVHDLSVHDLSVHDLSVQGPRMILNDYGKIADQQWYWLAQQYPYVILHEFIVMPNHIHGIIEISRDAIVGTGRDLSGNNNDTGTGQDLPGNNYENRTDYDLSVPKIKSLSGLMGAYKTTVSKKIHLLKYDEFAWQRSFYDHIIRDEKSYEKISNYIINNPNSWQQDKFFNR